MARKEGQTGSPNSSSPDTEPATVAELAQIKAGAPLKPKVGQNLSMDTGLFGDESKQIDLIDQLRQQDRKAAEKPAEPPPPASTAPAAPAPSPVVRKPKASGLALKGEPAAPIETSARATTPWSRTCCASTSRSARAPTAR